MGKPPSEPYDPLAMAVEEAHRRGWSCTPGSTPTGHFIRRQKPVSDNHVSKTHPEWVRTYGKYLWLDPGEPAAVDHSLAVIGDVVRRYDIDGVHLDDYFYPVSDQRRRRARRSRFPTTRAGQRAVRGITTRPSGPMPESRRLAPPKRRPIHRAALSGGQTGEAVGESRHQPIRHLAAGASRADQGLRPVCRALRRREKNGSTRAGSTT